MSVLRLVWERIDRVAPINAAPTTLPAVVIGPPGLSASEQAHLLGLIDTPAAAALVAFLQAPGAAATVAAALANNAAERALAVGEFADAQGDFAQAQGGFAQAQGGYALAQATAIGDIGTAVALATNARDAAIAASTIVRGAPGTGMLPGSTELAAAIVVSADGRAVEVAVTDGRSFRALASGVFDLIPSLETVTGLLASITAAIPSSAAIVDLARSVALVLSAPGLGLIPGTTALAAVVDLAFDGRPIAAFDGTRTSRVITGSWIVDALPIVAGPNVGMLPGTTELAASITLDLDGRVIAVTGDGGVSGIATQLTLGAIGLVPVGAPIAVLSASGGEPATFDAGGATVTVPAGSIAFPGDLGAAWPSTAVTSPATASDVVTGVAIAAGGGAATWLAHEHILSVQSVSRVSDGAAMVGGVNYTIDLTRGLVTNGSGEAMTMAYTGSRGRRDIVSIDPRLATPVPTLTQGVAKNRNAHLYLPALPAGHQEIARVTRKGSRAIFIPRWRWRNGVHLDRLAAEAEGRDYNRRILSPIVDRLIRGLRVRVIAHGNSRVAMGNNANFAKLNVNPNSSFSADLALNWSRDVPGYYDRYSLADRIAVGVEPAEGFDLTPGYGLTGGTPDGHGTIHCRGGYVWELLKTLKRAHPAAVIEYRNWSIGGTDSSSTISGDGRMNARHPARWDAVKADIIAGETLYIPIDAMNELGSSASYTNCVELATAAQALGAVVHFMGNARPDPRFQQRDADTAYSCREMARAAWDSGSAISDAWRLLSPANLPGLGLAEDEAMDATLQSHEGVPLQQAIGRDAAKSYS